MRSLSYRTFRSGSSLTRGFDRLLADAGRAAGILRREGSYALLGLVARKLISPFVEFGHVVFFVRHLDEDLPRLGFDSGIVLRQASPAEVPGLLLRPDSGSPEVLASVETSLGRQDRYFVAFDENGQPIHARWTTTRRGHIPELAMDLVLGPEDAYSYDGYTIPAYRRRGIDGMMRSFVYQRLRAEGRKRIYSYVRGDNPIGVQAARKWQRPLATLRYVRPRGMRPIVLGWRRSPMGPLLQRAPR